MVARTMDTIAASPRATTSFSSARVRIRPVTMHGDDTARATATESGSS
jgi:hypothetical protein